MSAALVGSGALVLMMLGENASAEMPAIPVVPTKVTCPVLVSIVVSPEFVGVRITLNSVPLVEKASAPAALASIEVTNVSSPVTESSVYNWFADFKYSWPEGEKAIPTVEVEKPESGKMVVAAVAVSTV